MISEVLVVGGKEQGAIGEKGKRYAINYLIREMLCLLEDATNDEGSSLDYDSVEDRPYEYLLMDSSNEDDYVVFAKYVNFLSDERVETVSEMA